MSDANGSLLTRLLWRPYRFMTISPHVSAVTDGAQFEGLSSGLMICGGLWGVGAAWLWGVAWHLFGDLGNSELVMPAVVTAVAVALWPMREPLVALARTVAPKRTTVRAIVAAAGVGLMTMAFYRLRAEWARSEYPLIEAVAWARPLCKIYRVLILMPIWGAWSMLIACQFCKRRGATDEVAGALTRSCGPVAATLWMAVTLMLTMAYYSYLGIGAQLVIPAVTIAVAIGASGAMRRGGGMSRSVLLAGNACAQLAHLLVFLVYQ